MKQPNKQPGFNAGAVSGRILWTWIQTLLGIGLLAALSVGTVLFLGFNWGIGVGILCLWLILPVFGWYFSSNLVIRLMRCQPPDPRNPNHARLVRIVDALFPKTGLSVKPPVYISPIPVPNAFATGRSPSQAFIACTDGLFEVGLTDEELEAVLAHELAHVKSRDVAITSLAAVLGSLFSILMAQGLPGLFHSVFTPQRGNGDLLGKLSSKVKKDKKRFFLPDGGIFGFLIMLVIFYLVGFFTKLVSMFVSRARESGADAYAAQWTGNPCALSTALQKIYLWITTHRNDIRLRMLTRGLAPILFVSMLDEEGAEGNGGLLSRLRQWWRSLGENHPPVPERMKMLDKMSGKACPRII